MEIRDFWGLTNLFLTETWTPSTRTLPQTYSSQFISSGSSLCDLWLFDLPYDFSLRSSFSAISGCSLCDLSVLFRLCDLSVCDLWFFSPRSLVLLPLSLYSSLHLHSSELIKEEPWVLVRLWGVGRR
ncbi:hypothetical protein Scep_014239 [Stephania cephalantha]|uniref:Uncharacterized protein n=1 Tax=Stephania cephalantha TaxID=152367 RepID=A0AAP0P062_9MAGN